MVLVRIKWSKDNDVDNDEDYKLADGRGVTADLSVGLPQTGGSRGRASTHPLIMSSHYEYYEFSHKKNFFFWMQILNEHVSN